MSSPKFQDQSSGSKSLVFIEFVFFAAAMFLAVYTNTLLNFVEYTPISTVLLTVSALIYSIVVQLSSLSLGLYNSKC